MIAVLDRGSQSSISYCLISQGRTQGKYYTSQGAGPPVGS
jgi:hypothetical protein